MPATAAKKKAKRPVPSKNGKPFAPTRILAIDIGGTKVKCLLHGENEPRKVRSGKRMTPGKMVEAIQDITSDWKYDAVSIGYPGLVGDHGPRSEPGNLGSGWVGFNYAAAFGLPVRISNDAAMQALGSYEGGRMLFLGLGTGLGSALIAEKAIFSLELGRLDHEGGKTLGEVIGRDGFERLGKDAWRKEVAHMVQMLMAAFVVDYVVIGGGNSKHLKELPAGARRGHNLTAFRGGFRLWNVEDVPTLDADGHPVAPPSDPQEWRMI
jgi:polyphosphate glucokinase